MHCHGHHCCLLCLGLCLHLGFCTLVVVPPTVVVVVATGDIVVPSMAVVVVEVREHTQAASAVALGVRLV